LVCDVFTVDRIGSVMVSMFVLSAVDRGFEPQSGQTKDFKIGICCFSANHAALRRKSKDWLAPNLGEQKTEGEGEGEPKPEGEGETAATPAGEEGEKPTEEGVDCCFSELAL
jgi:hypothetical protein